MTAPMTRERLALIRDGYKPALDDSYSEACVAVDVEDLRDLLDACESLLNERDGIRDAALEEAAEVPEQYVGCSHIAHRIRALKGKR